MTSAGAFMESLFVFEARRLTQYGQMPSKRLRRWTGCACRSWSAPSAHFHQTTLFDPAARSSGVEGTVLDRVPLGCGQWHQGANGVGDRRSEPSTERAATVPRGHRLGDALQGGLPLVVRSLRAAPPDLSGRTGRDIRRVFAVLGRVPQDHQVRLFRDRGTPDRLREFESAGHVCSIGGTTDRFTPIGEVNSRGVTGLARHC